MRSVTNCCFTDFVQPKIFFHCPLGMEFSCAQGVHIKLKVAIPSLRSENETFFEARGEVLNHGKKIPEQVDEVGFKISGKAWAPKRIDSEPLFCVTVWYIELNRST